MQVFHQFKQIQDTEREKNISEHGTKGMEDLARSFRSSGIYVLPRQRTDVDCYIYGRFQSLFLVPSRLKRPLLTLN